MASTSGSHAGRCPFIQTSLLGGVVRVDRFRLVVETFRVPSAGTTIVCPYIQFAATDLLPLCQQLPRKSFSLLCSASMSNQLPDSENVDCHQRTANNNNEIKTRQIHHRNDSGDDMFASFVDSPSSKASVVSDVVAVDRCRCTTSQLFVVDYCENISLRSRHIEQLSLQFSATGCFVGPPKISSCGCSSKSARKSAPPRLRMMRPVAVLFGSRSVRWFPVLHSGCVYRLILFSSDISPFLGKSELPRTSKTKLERHAARCLVFLDAKMHMERITSSSPGYGDSMLSAEEEAAISTAVDAIHERLTYSDGFWQQQQHTATANAR